jgi:Protein of unknown function (DUF3179)
VLKPSPEIENLETQTPSPGGKAMQRGGASEKTKKPSAALWVALVGALVSIACLAIPMYVIRPFRPQDAHQLAFALTVRNAGPWLSAACVIVVFCALFLVWRRAIGWPSRIGLIALSTITLLAAVLTHVNVFEVMFHPYPSPTFVDANSARIDAKDKVLAVRIGTAARGYPIRTMGYHHIVNDIVGDAPIAVTYCTLCHTALVWSRVLDGRTLYFRLAGINNGNALLRDEETNSIWQQSTGQAIFGPLKGRQLALVRSDELTFGLWHREQPGGLVLKPDDRYASDYETKDWETHIEKTHVVIDTSRSGIAPHELMLGVTVSGRAKAYPVKAILAAKVIQDQIAGSPILMLVGPDQASIRVFQAQADEGPLSFIPAQTSDSREMAGVVQDTKTQSIWNFQGCAIDGARAGHCLAQIDANKDYWFDWMNHHPGTAVYRN